MECQRIKNLYPDYKTNTYFFNKLIEYVGLDLDVNFLSKYYFTKSLNRIASPMLVNFYEDDNMIALFISNAYKKKWVKYFNVMNVEYNPINNYDMKESSSDTTTTDSTMNNSENLKSEDKQTGSENETMSYGKKVDVANTLNTTEESTGNSTNNKYGVNTTTPHPDTSNNSSDSTTKTDKGTNVETNSGADTNSRENSVTANTTSTKTQDTTSNENTTLTHTLTRSGNIGVTTTQQMLQSELALWQWNFYNDVVEDINNLLTLKIY